MYKFRLYVLGTSLLGAMVMSMGTMAQNMPAQLDPPKNWQNFDLKTDGYFGISLNQAYTLVKNKKSKPILVAILDSGVDTLQKDLQGVLWVNPKEIPGNGIDDDHNGYIDDVHGWDFLGGKGGKAYLNETGEEVRQYYKLKDKYANVTSATAGNEKEYKYWLQIKTAHDSVYKKSVDELSEVKLEMRGLMVANGYVKRALDLSPNATFTLSDLDKIKSKNDTITQSKYIWGLVLQQEGSSTTNAAALKDLSELFEIVNNVVNPDLTGRKEIVGDDPDVNDGKSYGNNILKYPDASHGTGVAGLIGAKRNNGYGIDGVADNVRIMVVKVISNGDEYDKDVANAIHYAVDNGARVINMSFGKKISPHKDWVDEAFKYAAAKDVLLIQAAGNDNEDMDIKPDYPNDTFADSSVTDADNVIDVGSSGPRPDTTLAADFTNYGKKNVDVFAPGVKVTSIDEDAEFLTADGTSFSAPIVTGIAALVLEYYPNLSAAQLKEVIMRSATPLNGTMVNKPGTHQKVDFATLCKTGGIVNAYNALEIASKMKGERKRE
jgi:cell wall-associated protease